MPSHSKRRAECRSIHQLAPGSGEEQNTLPNTSLFCGSGATIQSNAMFARISLRYLHPGQGQILAKFLLRVFIQLFPFGHS